jgi:hypothetical protein
MLWAGKVCSVNPVKISPHLCKLLSVREGKTAGCNALVEKAFSIVSR